MRERPLKELEGTQWQMANTVVAFAWPCFRQTGLRAHLEAAGNCGVVLEALCSCSEAETSPHARTRL